MSPKLVRLSQTIPTLGEARDVSVSERASLTRREAMDTLIDFFAGCMGGVVGQMASHPFDTAKVRLQLQTIGRHYRGTFHCLKVIVQSEGVRGLYKGITSPLYGVWLINAIVFGVQDNIQRQLSSPTSVASYAVSAGAAGIAQCVVRSPMELAKIRLQMQGAFVLPNARRLGNGVTYRGSIDCLAQIYRVEGVRGIYCGMGFTALRDVPSFMIYFASYAYLCRLTRRNLGISSGEPLPTWSLLLCGVLTGVLTLLPTYPIDVIKTRIQADTTREYNGYVDCIRKSWAREGCSILTKGLAPTIIRAFPTNAAVLATATWVLRQDTPEETEQLHIAKIKRFGVTPQSE